MNKKLLLTTILASSILGTGSNALADFTFSYNTLNGEITINNQTYTSLSTAAPVFEAIIENDEKPIGDITPSIRNYAQDLLNTRNNTVADLIQFARTKGANQKAIDFIPQALTALKQAQDAGLDFTQFITPALLEDPEAALSELGNQFGNIKTPEEFLAKLSQTTTTYKEFTTSSTKVNGEFTNFESSIKASNNTPLAALITERDNLKTQPAQDETTKAKIQALETQILADPIFISIRNSPETQEALKNAVKFAQIGQNDKLLGAAAAEQGKKFVAEIGQYIADPKTTVVNSLPAVQKPETHTTNTLIHSSMAATQVLNDRIIGFTPAPVSATPARGVSSGDIFQQYGVWIKGTYSQGEQKSFKAEPGYKFNQKGVTIGVDTGEESVLGIAYSFFQNDDKNKTGSSIKDKINTHMGSIYGMHLFNQEIFVTGQASYGYSDIKKSRATGDLNNNIAKGKTKGTTIGARAAIGYIYPINDEIHISPTLGFAHNSVMVKGYSETGDGLNRKIGKRTSTRNSGLVGLNLKFLTQNSVANIMPELHANLDYAFNGKNSATTITLVEGIAPLVTPSEKISKAFYNVGGSVKFAGFDMVEITGGYDLGLSKKFISHTGSLKLKVNL